MPRASIALADWGLGRELTSSVTRFTRGDVLFGAIRPYFQKVGVAPVDGVTNVSVFVIRPKAPSDSALVAASCASPEAARFATRVAKGTKMPVVAWEDFAKLPVPVADDNSRARFQATVEPLLDKLAFNVREMRALADLRDALLPGLIAGDIRLENGA
jgi:type I restriction enzyme S subunit